MSSHDNGQQVVFQQILKPTRLSSWEGAADSEDTYTGEFRWPITMISMVFYKVLNSCYMTTNKKESK